MDQLFGTILIVLPAKHLVNDVHVAEQVRNDAMVWFVLDVIKQDRAAAIQLFLD